MLRASLDAAGLSLHRSHGRASERLVEIPHSKHTQFRNAQRLVGVAVDAEGVVFAVVVYEGPQLVSFVLAPAHGHADIVHQLLLHSYSCNREAENLLGTCVDARNTTYSRFFRPADAVYRHLRDDQALKIVALFHHNKHTGCHNTHRQYLGLDVPIAEWLCDALLFDLVFVDIGYAYKDDTDGDRLSCHAYFQELTKLDSHSILSAVPVDAEQDDASNLLE